MYGFHNTLLRINAAAKSFDVESIPDEVLRRTLGGKGLATHLLLKHTPPGVDPLSPGNRLIFAAGPLAGTSVWGSCRYGVFTKSPLTGFYSESYSGGTAAEYMDRTGYDAVMIVGVSSEPIWIEIGGEGVFFHSAADLWGLDTFETEDRVRDWIREKRTGAKKSGVVTIGPAGENRVAFAVIENDYWRSAGRTGAGAVMGSKRIKAIAFWGNEKKALADPEALGRFTREFARENKVNAGVKAYKAMGTPMMVDILNHMGSFPTRYWHRGKADHVKEINAPALHGRCQVTPHACLKCFIACGRLTTVQEGKHRGLKIEGPEYETIYAFGGLCEVGTIEEIAYLNDLCDRLGLDTITAGNLAALAVEASRQGRIDFAVDYGETEKIAALLKHIAYRRGVGDTLASGIRVAAKAWGMEDQAIHVKGMEPAGYDPRVFKGMGLAYGISDRGACHLRTTFYKAELSGMIDPDKIDGKAEMFTDWEDRMAVFDALILCRFYRDIYPWEKLAILIEGVTGMTLDKGGMRRLAAWIADNTRRFNLREGLTPDQDRLPMRFHTEPLPETGKVITEEAMDQLLHDYYKARGWDDQGIPPAGG